MIMGELGPTNAGDLMDPRPLLAALEATRTIALAWSFQCGVDDNSLLTKACDPAIPNDAHNGGWGTLYRNFTEAGPQGAITYAAAYFLSFGRFYGAFSPKAGGS